VHTVYTLCAKIRRRRRKKEKEKNEEEEEKKKKMRRRRIKLGGGGGGGEEEEEEEEASIRILCHRKGSTRLDRHQKWIRGLGLYYCVTTAVRKFV